MTFQDAIDQTQVEQSSNQGVMINLNESGDTKIIWDHSKQLEIAIAKEAFNKAKKSGYMAYKVTGTNGEKGEIMHEFDSKAERIILAPPLAGGR